MKKNTSWKFTDELSVTFQSSVSGAGEFGLGQKVKSILKTVYTSQKNTQWDRNMYVMSSES